MSTSTMSSRVAGTAPGQRRLNGPQTTGRTFRNLSEPHYEAMRNDNVVVRMRDGTKLLADVHRPTADGAFPALVAASPYPRQIQDLGAPAGMIEAGATDFWVPRGYVHVIVNIRGTGGSEGTFGLMDGQERTDMHDVIEWVAGQPWCDGNVGMIGISYFAVTQLEAAVERPAHLKAIFPFATTADLYEAVQHHGLFSSTFVTPFLAMIGVASGRDESLWRGKVANAARRVLSVPQVHGRLASANGETAVGMLKQLARVNHDPHPWDDLWRSVAVEHPLRDAWWDERDLTPRLGRVAVPVYLGCDWDNVPLHLPATFEALRALTGNTTVRVGVLGSHGLTWPWESMHVEALAWFDHWLKERDTGILEGPPIRYWMPEANEWQTAEEWPPRTTAFRELSLRADGVLGAEEASTGERDYLCLGPGLNRVKASPTDPPSSLSWTTAPLEYDLDMVGDIELHLDARSTASDTAWIVTLQDVSGAGATTEVTAGWLRASLREVDEHASRPGAPVLPCRRAEAVPIGEVVHYRIPLVPNARRFKAGHSIRVFLTSDDQSKDAPAMIGFRHAPVGTSSHNTILSTSLLLLPVIEG